MSNEYKISNLLDIVELDDDQIDRICAELPRVLKYAKALNSLIITNEQGEHSPAVKILSPLTWIDDGKTELTITANCLDDQKITLKVDY